MPRHPFEWLTLPIQKRAFVILTLATVAVMAALAILGAPLKTVDAPLGIGSFEFAGTPSQAQQMLASWGPIGQAYAALNLGLDYLFLVLYSSSIALGCTLLADALKHQRRFLSGTGALLSWLQFCAGGLDAVENAALIKMLFGSPQRVWPTVAWWCALVKFALVAVGLSFVLIGTLSLLLTNSLNHKTPDKTPGSSKLC